MKGKNMGKERHEQMLLCGEPQGPCSPVVLTGTSDKLGYMITLKITRRVGSMWNASHMTSGNDPFGHNMMTLH